MLKRSTILFSGMMFGHALLGSVVFTGVCLSKQLVGKWLVVQVFSVDLPAANPPISLELDKYGKLIGRSRCGVFTGQWSTGQSALRFKGLMPSACECGEARQLEQSLIRAMGTAEQHRLDKNGLVLMHNGKAVAKLVHSRT